MATISPPSASPPTSTSASVSANVPTARNPWTPPTTHANGHAAPVRDLPLPPPDLHPSNLPRGTKSLSGISLRAALLGSAFGFSVSLSGLLAYHDNPLWRTPFFLTSLSLFHFLEYYTTATYNPSGATISAFLLSQNGSAYHVAHGLAFLETLLTHSLLPYPAFLPPSARRLILALGFGMLVVGQITRSVAMAQAGSNFNHTVQRQKRSGHELVTHGIYGVLRHPSYFGFWWWGLGTQVVLGNAICFVGYAIVLWRFFSSRIEREEELLIKFFGDEYVQYRKRTWVGIPFVH